MKIIKSNKVIKNDTKEKEKIKNKHKIIYLDGLRRDSMLFEDFVDP